MLSAMDVISLVTTDLSAPTDNRDLETGIIATLTIRSLFAAASAVGNWLLGYTVKGDRSGDRFGQEPGLEKEQRCVKTSTIGESPTLTGHSMTEHTNMKGNSYHVQAQNEDMLMQLPASHHGRGNNHEAGLSAIRAWEHSATSRIQHASIRKPYVLTGSEHPHSITQKQDLSTILAWEQANMGRLQRAEARRLERLSSTDWQEVRQEEQVREAVRAREQATERKVAREQGLQSVMDWDWERAKMKWLRNQGLGKKERRADVEDDGRVVS